MPRIIATAVLLTWAAKEPIAILKTKPPMPETRMTEATKMFLVLVMSTLSWMSILTPLEAMNELYRLQEQAKREAGKA